MSTLAYVAPGVSITEIVSPSFNPTLLDPTALCIVGPAQGYQNHTEVAVLSDQTPYTLSVLYPDISTLVLQDNTNLTLSPFLPDANGTHLDYTVDTSQINTTGQVTITRSMQTTITNGEKVSVYFENSGSPSQGTSKTDFIVLDQTTAVTPTDVTSGTQAGSISVSSIGTAPTADYSVTGSGGATPTIVWVNSATVLKKFQTVYLDYTVGSANYTDQPFQLNNLSTVSLPANASAIVVKTGPGVPATQAVKYQLGTTNTLDYIVSGSGAATAIARSAGTTTIGGANDQLSVRFSYQATPITYWQPTKCFSQSDVENKFGPALDSSGNIVNPASFAASLAFQNGINSVIIQALFTEGSPRIQPSGTVEDWENTLANLYGIQNLNVVVPIIAAGGLTTNDGLNLEILNAVQSFVNYMGLQQNQLVIAICGEDSTSGTLASESTLQAHAQDLGANSTAQNMVLANSGSFGITNPVTGLQSNVGGQYAAACLAGMLGRYPVQTPLTRKRVNVLTSVNDPRTEAQKNSDAAAGLLVIEAKNGSIQVRHAITTATDSIPHRELNVVRGKFWMMTNIQQNVDQQIVGQIVIDSNAAFAVQLVVTDVLELMVDNGAIVSYTGVQVQRDPTDPTAMQVQFSYLPAYPLNRVNIQFSVSSTSGVTVSSDQTQTQGI